MAVSKLVSGFECEFIEKPTEVFQTECLICLLVLREPYQVICCGKSFCRSCIERVRALNNPCPHCNKENFNDFPNKGLQQSIYQLKARCTHQKEGCKWTGELGALDNHLNLDSQPANQFKGCVFVTVKCTHCSESHQRRHINHHQSEVCLKCPFACEHCRVYKTTFEDVTTNHWSVCGSYPVRCSNKCGAVLQQQNIERHIAKDCPLTVIECELHYLGCEVKLPRKDMGKHLRAEFKAHKSMMAVSHRQEIASYLLQQHQDRQRIDELMKENEMLKEKVTELVREQGEDKVRPPVNEFKTLPVDIVMPIFEQHKNNNDAWFSSPFYTHHRGHKLCLKCDANGFSVANGTHVSVTFCMMRGEFDDELKWPLKCHMTIMLLNRDKFNTHYKKTIALNIHVMSRVTEGDIAKEGSGMRHYVSHDDCYKQYIKNDSLYFRIVKVTMK